MSNTLYRYALYIEIFVKYINVNYTVRPNMYKFGQLLQEKEKHVLYNLGKYIVEAMSLRIGFLS